MGWGVTPYKEWTHARPVDRACVEYGKRIMREWFGHDLDPYEIYGAMECGWQSFCARFKPEKATAKIFVGYDVCMKPSWACKRLGVEPIMVPNLWDNGYGYLCGPDGSSSPVFASGECWNYPVHPSICFSVNTKTPNLSLSFDGEGRLNSFSLFGQPSYWGYSDSVHVFFNPGMGHDQPTPKRQFNGPTDDQLQELVAAMLGQKELSECEMFRLLRAPKDLCESLLGSFGNSPSCFVDEDASVRDKAAYEINAMIKEKPWAWINAGKNTEVIHG